MTIETDCTYILQKHMGPSSKAFLERQCRHHLKKEPSALEKQDLDVLANWCFIGIKLAIDEVTANAVKSSILALKR